VDIAISAPSRPSAAGRRLVRRPPSPILHPPPEASPKIGGGLAPPTGHELLAFINNYNHTATPVRWTYDDPPLKAA
jgi:hypothetical protein